MTDIDYYRLGRSYSYKPQDEYLYDDLPPMTYTQTLEFNRGCSDGMREQLYVQRLFQALCVVTVAACVFFWWVGK